MACDLSEDATLLLAWVLRLSLNETSAGIKLSPSLVQELLYHGDPLDLLRPQASAAPQANSRTGLIIQPFLWALALAMVDIATNARRRAVGRYGGGVRNSRRIELYTRITYCLLYACCHVAMLTTLEESTWYNRVQSSSTTGSRV